MPRTTKPDTFSARLRALRAAAGLTQQQLADAAGVHAQTVQHFEYGVKDDPRMSTLRKLAAALGVAPGDLIP